MRSPAAEREQALRWLIANRRPDVCIEQAVRMMCTMLPRDLATMQVVQRIVEEEKAKAGLAARARRHPCDGLAVIAAAPTSTARPAR